MKKFTYIYGLVDPRNGEIKYIGQSPFPYGRLCNHQQRVVSRLMKDWLLELKSINSKPYLLIFEKVFKAQGNKAEQKYIKLYFSQSELCNMKPLKLINQCRTKNGYKKIEGMHFGKK